MAVIYFFSSILYKILRTILLFVFFQCFDTVAWAAGRASSL